MCRMIDTSVLESNVGGVRFLRPSELPKYWNLRTSKRFMVCKTICYIMHVFEEGESMTAYLMAQLGSYTVNAIKLTCGLCHMYEQKNYVQKAHNCNVLIWRCSEISSLSRDGILMQSSGRGGNKAI